jgi:hypothetical protein
MKFCRTIFQQQQPGELIDFASTSKATKAIIKRADSLMQIIVVTDYFRPGYDVEDVQQIDACSWPSLHWLAVCSVAGLAVTFHHAKATAL